MKEYLGNYLGLCINNDDPERRGRVQIFIPHIMPALFKNWNEVGEDIQMLCVGDNIPDSIPSFIVEKLKKMLPWAECASPILGASSPGQSVGNNFDQSPVVGGAGNVSPVPGAGLPSNVTLGQGDTPPKPELASLLSQAATTVYGPGATVEIFSGTEGRSSGTDRHPGGWAADVLFRDASGNIITGDGLAPVVKFWHDNQLGSTGLNWGGGKIHMDLVGGRFGRPLQGGEALWWSYGGGLSPNMRNAVSNVLDGKNGYKGLSNASSAYPTTNSLSLNSDSHQFTSLGGGGNQTPHQSANPFDLMGTPTFATPSVNAQGGDASIASNQAPSLGGAASEASATANAAGSGGGGGGGLLVDQRGRVGAPQLKTEVLRIIQSNPSSIYNNGRIPINGERYGIDGTSQGWANFYGKLAGFESGYFANSPFKDYIPGFGVEPGGSGGLFQLGRDQIEIWATEYPQLAQAYGFQAGVNYSPEQYLDPNFSTRGMLFIGEALLTQSFAVGPGQGLGRTIGYSSWNKIASGQDPGTGAADPSMRPAAASSLVSTTDSNGATSSLNINNMAKGVFTYPSAGALLWVFFREGNPLFPVYFAANYGQREWESAFRMGSDAPGMKPAATEDNPTISTGTLINFGWAGLKVDSVTDPSNPSNNQKSIMLFGNDGSNMFINDGYHQIYSRMDRRDQVDGSRFQTTLGVKEEIIQSDSNSVVMGDRIIKVGNITPEAINAMNQIHDIIKEIMKPLSESSGPSITPFPTVPQNNKYGKYLQKAIEQSKANYTVPEGPYKIPAQEVLRDLGFVQPEVPQPPLVQPIEEIPITPPTPSV